MGMFDSVMVPLKCPNCGDEGEKELQTKDLACEMDVYHVGDYVGTDQYRWLDCAAGCRSKTCLAWEQTKWKGLSNGFGYGWDVMVKVNESGHITGEVRPTGLERSAGHQESIESK